MLKGQITVFLSLILTILLSFLLTVIEGARTNAMRMKIESTTDMALHSVFAEYHREMLKQYDLFFIDTSYGTTTPNIENTAGHMKSYMEYNLNPKEDKDINVFPYRDWYAVSTTNMSVVQTAVASDRKGAVLKRQAIDYIKDKVGLDEIEKVIENVKITKKEALDTRNITAEREENESNIHNMELPKEEIAPDEWRDIEIHNPADGVNAARGSGLLSLIVDNPNQISARSVNLSEYSSRRKLAKGQGEEEVSDREFSGMEELLFGEYIFEKCSNYKEHKEKNLLKYQIEYILAGKNSDKENLKKVVNKLLMLREVSNVIYLFGDTNKMAEAEALAATISAVTLVPELQPLIKYSLLFAWAFAESVNDLKILLGGGKVPLMKASEDWKLSLIHMLTFQQHLSKESNSQKGISYEMYLKIFMQLMNAEEKTKRLMDIMEMDIRQTVGNNAFRIDGCIDSLTVDAAMDSQFGYSYQIKRKYKY